MGRNAFLLLPVLLLAGCATPPTPAPSNLSRPASVFPTNGLVTQRAILTARGRQFALNGYVALDATRGRRLIVTEMFGQVIGDVLVKPDGAVFVMRSSPMLRPAWIRRFLADDLECVFSPGGSASCPIRALDSKHFLVNRRWYKLDLRILEILPGPQAAELFDETRAQKP